LCLMFDMSVKLISDNERGTQAKDTQAKDIREWGAGVDSWL